MKLTEIDHVGIAVRDLETAVKWYEDMFGATVEHRERIEKDGVDEALLKVADSYIQLLQPFTDASPMAKWVEKNNEGMPALGMVGRSLQALPIELLGLCVVTDMFAALTQIEKECRIFGLNRECRLVLMLPFRVAIVPDSTGEQLASQRLNCRRGL